MRSVFISALTKNWTNGPWWHKSCDAEVTILIRDEPNFKPEGQESNPEPQKKSKWIRPPRAVHVRRACLRPGLVRRVVRSLWTSNATLW